MAHKIASWFVTEKGKKFTFAIACTTGIGICSICTIPHTFLLDKYKEIVHLYKYGFPVALPQNARENFNKAMDLLNVCQEYKALIKPFSVVGFEIFHAGSIYSKFGGIIGLPINFGYNTVEDIEKKDIMILQEPVNWSKPEGQDLLNSLILSDNAQIFAIAREILSLNSFQLFFDTFYASSVFVFMYGLGNNINGKFNFYSRPISLRLSLYGIITIFGYGLYSFLTDATQNYFDKQVDKELSEKSEIFVEGGKEFYEKTLARNVALRKLMGSFGEKQYTALGNEYFMLRQKRLPLIDRRDFFVNKIKATM